MSVIAQAGAKGRQLHKFGGSSLADVKCYLRVAGIMTEYSQPGDMMVVSAAGSTTNQLISWLKLSQTDRGPIILASPQAPSTATCCCAASARCRRAWTWRSAMLRRLSIS